MKKISLFFVLVCALSFGAFALQKGGRPLNCNDDKKAFFIPISFERLDCDSLGSQGLWLDGYDKSSGYRASMFVPVGITKPSKLIVRIPGGPGDKTSSKFDSKLIYAQWIMRNARNCNAIVLNLSYTGSAERYSDEIPLIDDAIKDIEVAFEEIDSKFARDEVLVIAESLGGYIALASDIKIEQRNVVFVNPLIVSPNEFRRRLAKIERPVLQKKVRYYSKDQHFWHEKFISSDVMLNDFFGPHIEIGDIDFESMISERFFSNGLMIYDVKDSIRSSIIEPFAISANLKVAKFAWIDHAMRFPEPMIRRATGLIDDHMSNFCSLQ